MDDLDRPAFDGTELDFWLGEWDCSWAGGHGTNRLSRILGERVILEEFEAAPDPDGSGALTGRSWSVFDAERRLWRQTWVDDQGSYFDPSATPPTAASHSSGLRRSAVLRLGSGWCSATWRLIASAGPGSPARTVAPPG